MSEPMSREHEKSKYADLLNDLDAMQQSMAYAVRRPVLQQAEQTIVMLEKDNAALRAENDRLKDTIQAYKEDLKESARDAREAANEQ